MSQRRICILGAGYVGLVTAAGLAHLGNDVRVYDPDRERLALLRAGRAAFFEPDLDDAIAAGLACGRLHASATVAEAVADVDAVFIAVGTPSTDEGKADIGAVERAAEELAPALTRPAIVVNKSTVPVETADVVERIVRLRRPELAVSVVSNPEFLREGSALADFFHPDRIVLGTEDPAAERFMRELYSDLTARVIVTDRRTAELIKYASNAFLATKISFINEISSICEKAGGRIDTLIDGLGADPRIGSAYLQPGLGFGGSCLPKDVRALCSTAMRVAAVPTLLSSVLTVNRAQVERVAARIAYILEGLPGNRIALLGLSFKERTDDVRESPALALARLLLERGASLSLHDPAARIEAAKALAMFTDERATQADSVDDCVRDADAIVIATPWPEYRSLDPERLAALVRRRIVFDARNALDGERFAAAGFHYSAVGRASLPYPLATPSVGSA